MVVLGSLVATDQGVALENKLELVETGLAVVVYPTLAVGRQLLIKEGVWHMQELTVEPREVAKLEVGVGGCSNLLHEWRDNRSAAV